MKKKLSKKVLGSSLLLVAVIGMTGCGVNKKNISNSKSVGIVQAENKDGKEEESFIKDKNQDIITDQNKEENSATEVPMLELPEGITGMKAENVTNKELRELIIDYYEIPEEYCETTKYYYNYVDLNDDGINEIFVVISGPYTSGTGGDSALWIVENAGKLHVNQDFTLVHSPIIVSDKITNGVHELVVPYYGGGAESQYSILTCSDGEYTRVGDGNMVKTLDGITGKAIIANDILSEIDAGINALSLLDE